MPVKGETANPLDKLNWIYQPSPAELSIAANSPKTEIIPEGFYKDPNTGTMMPIQNKKKAALMIVGIAVVVVILIIVAVRLFKRNKRKI